jgi:hypothetical protein
MIHLFAFYDRKAEVWVGKTEGLPIKTEAATLDELVAKVWARVRDLTEDRLSGPFELVVTVDPGLLETLHLMSSPANAKRLDEAIAAIEHGKVMKRDL